MSGFAIELALTEVPHPLPLPLPPSPLFSQHFLLAPIFSVLSSWTDLTNLHFSEGMWVAHLGNMHSCPLV